MTQTFISCSISFSLWNSNQYVFCLYILMVWSHKQSYWRTKSSWLFLADSHWIRNDIFEKLPFLDHVHGCGNPYQFWSNSTQRCAWLTCQLKLEPNRSDCWDSRIVGVLILCTCVLERIICRIVRTLLVRFILMIIIWGGNNQNQRTPAWSLWLSKLDGTVLLSDDLICRRMLFEPHSLCSTGK